MKRVKRELLSISCIFMVDLLLTGMSFLLSFSSSEVVKMVHLSSSAHHAPSHTIPPSRLETRDNNSPSDIRLTLHQKSETNNRKQRTTQEHTPDNKHTRTLQIKCMSKERLKWKWRKRKRKRKRKEGNGKIEDKSNH